MSEMYDHEADGFPFGDNPPEIKVSMQLPPTESIIVNGTRSSLTIIQVAKGAEHNPKRDAKVLATILSTSLEDQTIYHLAELLYVEHIAPMLQDRQMMLTELNKVTPSKKAKKEVPNEPQS